MRHVSFDPEKLSGRQRQWWDAWQASAAAATDKVVQAWENWRASGSNEPFVVKFDQKLWTRLKEFLLKHVFEGKCAYCETVEARSSYHAEHFRPKGRVMVRVEGVKRRPMSKRARTLDEEGREIDHPGYFWLAYNWMNLLPSCNDCNTARGKRDYFPVEDTHVCVRRLTPQERGTLKQQRIESAARAGVFFLQPEDLDALEKRQLLHPYLDDPEEHLVFGEFGVVAARDGSVQGEQSIITYDLRSEKLRVARQAAQEAAVKDYMLELARGSGLGMADRIATARTAADGYIRGTRPYSAAVLAYLRSFFPQHGI
jgi:hypothetical protein